MMGGLVVLMATRVLPPEQALQGFASPALFTIASLLIITAGIQRTDALRIVHRWLTFSGDRVHEGQVLGGSCPLRLCYPDSLTTRRWWHSGYPFSKT